MNGEDNSDLGYAVKHVELDPQNRIMCNEFSAKKALLWLLQVEPDTGD